MVVKVDQEQLLLIGDINGFDEESVGPYIYTEHWPVEYNSLDKVTVRCVLEYLTGPDRIKFMNNLYYSLKPDGLATLYVPFWASPNGVADPYLAWPPITELSIYYLASGEFRERNKLKYTQIHANFDVNYGYSYTPEWQVRSDKARDYHLSHSIGVIRELVVTLRKLP